MRRLLVLLVVPALGLTVLPAAGVADPNPSASGPRLPEAVAALALDATATSDAVTPPSQLAAEWVGVDGRRQVVAHLSERSVAEVAALDGLRLADLDLQRRHARTVDAQQQRVLADLAQQAPGLEVLATLRMALNAVVVEADADELALLTAHPQVVRVDPVVDYELDLSETVPYIGAALAAAEGLTGEGLTVAVIDSGIDYTHARLGGPGTEEAFERAYGGPAATDPEDTDPGNPRNRQTHDDDGAYFPTDKVIDGFDFVGEFWAQPGDTLRPNPNPIDVQGHGTNVADIIAGVAPAEGEATGVAPDARLYALKVCSSFAPPCSGVAMLQAMDFALDPVGDGDVANHADVINISLGSSYGQALHDPVSQAIDNAAALGVLTTVSVGNSSDRPFVAGTPEGARAALSVAQSQVPSAVLHVLEILEPPAAADAFPAVHQPWSPPLAESVTAPVQYGDGDGGNTLGCEPFDEPLDGLIVLVDRGECNFTLKISHIGQAGAEAGLIGLVTPGLPFAGGDGGDRPIDVPGFIVSQEANAAIQTALAAGATVTARLDPERTIPLVGTMVASSSRGPSGQLHEIKPEIGAPGASVSALAGSGTGTRVFGGTSGAAPMVAGAAALVRQAYPERDAAEVKAVLMGTAERLVAVDPPELDGRLAPITRIGAGEVRVDRAIVSPAAAWDAERPEAGAALSFGFVDVTETTTTLARTVNLRDYSGDETSYRVATEFRFDEDAGRAVSLSAPEAVTVPAGGDAEFDVTLTIDGAVLEAWRLDSGPRGNDGDALTAMEFDGYVTLSAVGGPHDGHELHLPWHVLPRQSADVTATPAQLTFAGETATVELANDGVGPARVDAYSLVATSPRQFIRGRPGEQLPVIDLRAVGTRAFEVEDDFVMQVAVNAWDRQTHANAPGRFELLLDVDGDGQADFAVFDFDLALPSLADGRSVVWVVDLQEETASAAFFTDHGTNSSNTVLTLWGSQLGLSADDLGRAVAMDVLAVDFFYGGRVTDAIFGLEVVPGGERYVAGLEDVPAGDSRTLTAVDTGEEGSSGVGLLLLLDANRGAFRGGAPEGNEALVLPATPADGGAPAASEHAGAAGAGR